MKGFEVKMKTMKKWISLLAFVITLSSAQKMDSYAKNHNDVQTEVDQFDFLDQVPFNDLYVRDQVISGSGISNAILSDLECEKNSSTGFTNSYFILNQALQVFYEIYGKEEVLNQFQSPDFMINFYQELQQIGLTEEEILSFFRSINCLEEYYQSNESFELLEEKEAATIHLAQSLIQIYEKKTNLAWQENIRIQAIILAMIHSIDLVKYETCSSELQTFQEQPNFLSSYYIDLTNTKNVKVSIESDNPNWNGDFCFTFQRNEFVSEDMVDIFCFSFDEQNNIQNIKSYNSAYENQKEYLKQYGITREEDIAFCMNNSFFMTYETGIRNCTLLDEKEKLSFMKHFIQFTELHSKFFENETSKDILQVLFLKALKSCETKEQIYDLLIQEDIIYELGGEVYQQELMAFGITNLEEQKFYIQNLELFNYFLTSIEKFSLELEEQQYMVGLFKSYLLQNEVLQNGSLDECRNYLNVLFHDKSLGEIHVILKSNVMLKPNNMYRSRKVIRALV